jgi:uncharacterized coiled-coil DUF342 family protein
MSTPTTETEARDTRHKETRELHKQKVEAQLAEWAAKIDQLKAHADKLTAQARLDARPHLDQVHTKFAAAKAKLLEIATATDERWTEVTKGADDAWHDVKSSVEGAYDALKPHVKD